MPYSRLQIRADKTAWIDAGLIEGTDQLSLLLQHVIRMALPCPDEPDTGLQLQTTSLDLVARPSDPSQIDFTTSIDRQTRTLVFASGQARQAGRTLMRMTSVYRKIRPGVQRA